MLIYRRDAEALLANQVIAGVDEAGRGPLAGPVVAAAVILEESRIPAGLNDSKKLTPKRRENLYQEIIDSALAVSSAFVSAAEIDRLNILQASLLAMKQAVNDLSIKPDFLYIDGSFSVDLDMAQLPLPKADGCILSVAAASIVAKVQRDRWMIEQAKRYPDYGFEKHKGYPTPAHQNILKVLGPCDLHRRSFSPVKQWYKEHEHA